MRLHFQQRPWDLFVGEAYTLILGLLMFPPNAGGIVWIFGVFLFPGYVVMSALFPADGSIDWIERLALSFGLSLAVMTLIGVLLNMSAWGVHLSTVGVVIVLFTGLVGVVGYLRRMQLPPQTRLSMTIELRWLIPPKLNRLDKTLVVLLASLLVIAGGIFFRVSTTPNPGQLFTEFQVLGPGGKASDYPTRLSPSEVGVVLLGIENHEAAIVQYEVRVDLVGVRFVFNSTAQRNETVELNRTTLSWLNATIGDGQNWTQPYAFSIPFTGAWVVHFLLFKNWSLSAPYRGIRLDVTVS